VDLLKKDQLKDFGFNDNEIDIIFNICDKENIMVISLFRQAIRKYQNMPDLPSKLDDLTYEIRTGDTVEHLLTGETWLVAYVKGNELVPCGWPESFAMLVNCRLIKKGDDKYRDDLIRQMAKLPASDSRGIYARNQSMLARMETE